MGHGVVVCRMLGGDPRAVSVGKTIPTYLVAGSRVQGTILAVLRLGVATLRGQSRLPRLFRDVPGLISVTFVLVPNSLDVALTLLEPILGRKHAPTTAMAITICPWKLMC